MTRTSEWVAPGHPDKVADAIVSYLLDRHMERDPLVRFALECQVKDDYVTLGGEVTTQCPMSGVDLRRHVRDAVRAIGYTPEYARRWGAGNCIDPDALDVTAHIGMQSPDIAQGVDDGGWGDQGIFWGMATGTEATGYMPLDHYLARRIGMRLYTEAQRRDDTRLGLDIKTQVTVKDGMVDEVIVAVPTTDPKWTCDFVDKIAVSEVNSASSRTVTFNIVVNGTGAYVRHASAGDCGTTGRKLAVDFYGGNCFIGGGCPWGKDPSKADVTLNVYARHLALDMREKTGDETVYCAISCCIGRRETDIVYYDGSLREITQAVQRASAREIAASMGLDRPVYAKLCAGGLFGRE